MLYLHRTAAEFFIQLCAEDRRSPNFILTGVRSLPGKQDDFISSAFKQEELTWTRHMLIAQPLRFMTVINLIYISFVSLAELSELYTFSIFPLRTFYSETNV